MNMEQRGHFPDGLGKSDRILRRRNGQTMDVSPPRGGDQAGIEEGQHVDREVERKVIREQVEQVRRGLEVIANALGERKWHSIEQVLKFDPGQDILVRSISYSLSSSDRKAGKRDRFERTFTRISKEERRLIEETMRLAKAGLNENLLQDASVGFADRDLLKSLLRKDNGKVQNSRSIGLATKYISNAASRAQGELEVSVFQVQLSTTTEELAKRTKE